MVQRILRFLVGSEKIRRGTAVDPYAGEMASSPVKFFSVFLVASAVGWAVFTFASRMLAWFLSRVMSASVSFHVAGFNCLRDVHIKFRKGSIESASVGEIKLSFRKSLVKLGVSVISKDPKLQLLISDIELVMWPSGQSKKTAKSHKSRSTGKGKWFVITSAARFLSVWVTDLVVKIPKAGIEVKELKLDIFKIAGPNQSLEVKLHLVPLSLQFGDYGFGMDPVCHYQPDCSQSDQTFPLVSEKSPAQFVCDDVMVTYNFGHEKEKGVRIKNLDLTCGDIMVNLDESLFSKSSSNADKNTDIPGATSARKSGISNVLSAIKKQVYALPEKVSFSVPKLDAKFMRLGERITIENNITGIQLSSVKLPSHDETGEATSHFDVQLDLSEIHLVRGGGTSFLEILKVATVASIDVPVESDLPVRAEIDAKLGGTLCNLDVSRLIPWMHLYMSRSKKGMNLAKQSSHTELPQENGIKAVLWTCTLSAPEMTIMFYSLNGIVLYHGCSQSTHLYANNIASKGVQVNTELGEIQLHMEEYREFMKENVFGVDTYSGSLLNISRVSFDWGYREAEMLENSDLSPGALIFSVDISGMVVQFGSKHIELLLLNLLSFKTLFKSLSSSVKKSAGKSSTKKKPRGTKIFKLNMEKCSISFAGETSVLETTIADPKRVNFGSQGGEVIISVSADGTPRKASISSDLGDCKSMKFCTSLVVSHLTACLDKENESTQIELQRVKSVFEEYPEANKPSVKVTLFDLQNAKVIKQPSRVADFAMCMIFSATDIAVQWDIDVYLALYESFARFKSMLRNMNPKVSENKMNSDSAEVKSTGLDKDSSLGKGESIIAVDVEVLNVTAELADGVRAKLYVQSIFTENAKIGLLMEGLVLRFNQARVLRSTRLQVSRIPSEKGELTNSMMDLTCKRGWVVQGTDVYVCMPFRLPLRAIEDAIEDTIRGMKLIIAAKTSLIHPSKTQNPKKPGSSSSNPWSVRFVIRKLTAYIEEEPIQGWLDEHYHLMRTAACESDARLRFLDEIRSGSGNSDGTGPTETEAFDMADLDKLKEEVHKKTFQSYYSDCQKMVFYEGSGCKSCSIAYQAGFKPSLRRASLLSLCGTELDVKLMRISGGNSEMVDFIKGLDSAVQEKNIPFSRFYGSDISVTAGSLVFQLRDYTFPLFAGTSGKCQGRIVFAQQATCFQPQIYQEIFVGRWHKVSMLRSASGTTPPMKMYSNLPIYFNKGDISFGVGYEPSFADISYAFQVALRKTNLSTRGSKDQPVPPKKEKSLPWWDEMRYYIHGKIELYFNQTEWNILATTNPYERLDKLQIISDYMDITQTDGHVDISAKEFKMNISSLQSLMKNCSLRVPSDVSRPFIYSPNFSLNVIMDWECESGNPLNHYLHALPIEGEPRKRVLDPFRSTSLSLRWHFSLRPPQPLSDGIETIYDSSQKLNIHEFPTMNLGGHDLAWVFKWWGLNYSPPNKLRSFSRWPRFGIPRATRSGNLSLDKVMTEFCLRIDATPCCIKHMPLGEDDPASGLTFRMSKLRYELCYSRGKHKYTFESKREPLDLVYRGLDLHMPKVYLNEDVGLSPPEDNATTRGGYLSSLSDKQKDEGFLLSSDYFWIGRQAPKADPMRLLAWQDAGRRNNLEMTYVRSEFENGSGSDQSRSDPSDDAIADNCQRVFVYGLKLLWTIENRNAVWSWVGAISKAFESPKPSPSQQYAQRKIMEEKQTQDALKTAQDDSNVASTSQGVPFNVAQVESVASTSSPPATKVRHGHIDDSDEEGTWQFMVNVIQPQFNLHSEEANGRFLLAAASGCVLARSFHSVLHVGYEMIEQALGETNLHISESPPEMTWKRAELSVMLEHVQAHVAPTDVDPGAGLQWLPKILGGSDKLKRTGALLEQVFMPCQMYFRYTRHKGGTAELKVKPLKELSFNSPNITATMTSRQFQVMLDVLSNLLFARLPKPRKNGLVYLSEDDEDVEEEADEVVPDGVEEVELVRINLEQRERERKLLLDDIRTLREGGGSQAETCTNPERDSEGSLWMVIGGKPVLVQALKKELVSIRKSRKAASFALRKALQKAAQVRLMEKEKNKSPSCAMRISMRINKVVWSMLADGKTFAETEINDMTYDFDRDYKDIGVAHFTTKSFVVRNCLPNAKSDMLLSAWNPPPEWGKNVMLCVDAKQGAPKDGHSPLELFQVEIFPLKIYLTETMYRMMWDYFFPEEEQDSQRRQEVWRVSTSAGARKMRKSFAGSEGASTSTHSTKDIAVPGRLSSTGATSSFSNTRQSGSYGENSQVSKLQSLKANMVCGSNPELRHSSSADKNLEENVAENGTGDLILQLHSSIVPSKGVSANPTAEQFHALIESSKSIRPKDSNRSVRAGLLSHEEKKFTKPQEEKRARSRKLMEFHNIKISRVEFQVTYEGSRLPVNDLRLLMDTFHRAEFTGTWRRLFSKVKKHIIWGVLKSVAGMQDDKFKDKAHNQADLHCGTDLNLSDSDGGPPGSKGDQFPVSWLKRPSDGAGDGFVTSIRGLFNSQRRKAKPFVLRMMRGDKEESEYNGGAWSESDSEFPFARQLTITKAKKLIKRHTKKFRSRGQKSAGLTMQQESVPSTPRETTPFQSESSGESSYEDFHE